jgi:DNA-directed RNA polymerase specialized sigma24 family protein
MSDLNAIIEAHSDAVWRTAYRLLNHREDALDCYQETFLAALQLARKDEIRHWRTH